MRRTRATSGLIAGIFMISLLTAGLLQAEEKVPVTVDVVSLICGVNTKGGQILLEGTDSSVVGLPTKVAPGTSCAVATGALFDAGYGSAAGIDPKDGGVSTIDPKDIGVAIDGSIVLSRSFVSVVNPKIDPSALPETVTLLCSDFVVDRVVSSKRVVFPSRFIGVGGGCAMESGKLYDAGFGSAATIDPKDGGVSTVDPKDGGVSWVDPKDIGVAIDGAPVFVRSFVSGIDPKDIGVSRGVVTLVCSFGISDLEVDTIDSSVALPSGVGDASNNCNEQTTLLFSAGFLSAAHVDPKDGGVSTVDPKDTGVAIDGALKIVRTLVRISEATGK